ncbi:hypothetical protein ABGN05_05755 [Aquibium sp. LZ166]|uniref:Uncharacterized protein n=1 Tax=Aquibium pacificus TaxID=3153579 RepID=A0ABV3SEH7_9HYPH
MNYAAAWPDGLKSIREHMMASKKRSNESMAAKAVWPLLFLTAALHAYLGLSLVAYVFMGVSNPASGPGGWIVATTGGLQAVAATAAFVLAARRDLRGATLAVAGSIMMGWFSTLPSVAEQGLDFRGNDRIASVYFVLSPIIAIVAGTLAWRNLYPIAAALIATATTFAGIVFVIAFAIAIATYGF